MTTEEYLRAMLAEAAKEQVRPAAEAMTAALVAHGLAFVTLASALHERGHIDLANLAARLERTAEALPYMPPLRERAEAQLIGLARQCRSQAEPKSEAERRRALFQLIEGGLPSPPASD